MPISKKSAGDGTLYALIAFVALFIIAATLAVICYIKLEEQRGLADTAKRQLAAIASDTEIQKLGAIVGTENEQQTRLGTVLGYLDETISLILPGVPADTSAEVKVSEATAKTRTAIAAIAKQNPDLNNVDPNTSLLQITESINSSLQNTRASEAAGKEQLQILQDRFDDAMKASIEKEKILLAEKEKFQEQFETASAGYDELKGLLEKKTTDQVKDLYSKLDQERAGRDELNKQLLRTQAELRAAEDRIQRVLKDDVWPVRPPPDVEVKAFEPDGKILLVDNQEKIVHINLGSDEHVYRGLTFSVYDKNRPIPRDGKGKAEIEVYNVEKTVSTARIISSNIKNPIVVDDIAANLIWDTAKVNTFVVAGDFDLTGSGQNAPDAIDKIKGLIEKWGAKTADQITVNTDFVVLGTPPEVPTKPTLEETEIYPNAMARYENAVERLADYKEIQSQAQNLSIPIFNADRFLYFIGYKTQAGKPGAF